MRFTYLNQGLNLPETFYNQIIKGRALIPLITIYSCISLHAQEKKLPSPHAVLSKFWGLYLIIEFTLLIIGVAGTHFKFALVAGIIVHIDRVLIYIFLRHWDHDIPSCYHAFQIRKGKAIKRNRIFNG